MVFRKLHIGLTFAITIFAVSGCGSTKLLDIEKTSKTLQLSVNQREVAHAKIQQIEKIVEDYELEKKNVGIGVDGEAKPDARWCRWIWWRCQIRR